MTSWLAEFVRRLRALFRKEALDRDLDDEMAAHLDFSIEENIRQGFGPEEARRRALIRFGGQQHAREQHRDARGLPMLEVLMQDMRYAARTFRRERSFTLIAISILALGIGANTAVFSVVNTILLRPLPFRDSQRLCWLTVGNGEDGKFGLSGLTYTVDAYEEFQRHNQSFEEVTSYNPFLGNGETKLLGRGEPQAVLALMVAGNFFQTLGVEPALGRLFRPEECKKGGKAAVALFAGYIPARRASRIHPMIALRGN